MAEAGGRWVDRTARARAGGGIGKYPGLFAGFAGHGLAFLKLADKKRGCGGASAGDGRRSPGRIPRV
jgi:hypothetical protein